MTNSLRELEKKIEKSIKDNIFLDISGFIDCPRFKKKGIKQIISICESYFKKKWINAVEDITRFDECSQKKIIFYDDIKQI